MYKNIVTQALLDPSLKSRGIEADVLRLDLMHPLISGNKWFKLMYHLSSAKQHGKTGLVSFGGAYSNHLVALAYASLEKGFRSAAIIRGEQSLSNNHSLQMMRKAGMDLLFVNRGDYKNKNRIMDEFLSAHTDYYYVPEGGQSPDGIKGACEILPLARKKYTHVICAVGTGTTLAGIVNSSEISQEIIGICSLKISSENENDLLKYLAENCVQQNYNVNFDYHFGGYAKKILHLSIL